MRASKSRWVLSVLIRPALWCCACALLVTAASAQCTNPTQVPNGTYTSGDHSQVDNNALSASSFAVSQGAAATFAAGNCIHLGPGFRANAFGATVPTTFQAWVDIAPTAVSVSPSSPPPTPPLSQAFTWTVASPAGQSNLSHVFALFSATSTSTANACYIHYDASTNLVYLADNASTNWLGGFLPSSSGSATNSQCTISGTGSPPNPMSSGTQLGLTLNVTFNAASFPGNKYEYLYALDVSGVSTGWQQMGTWTVPGPPAPDFELTAAPTTYFAPLGTSYPTYTITVAPQNGFNSAVSFSANPFFGCRNALFNPVQVSGPPWTTTLTMTCDVWGPISYWTMLYASGGGKSHQIQLDFSAGQSTPWYLETVVSPPEGGSISPGNNWYADGAQVTVTAAANSGYQFTGFSGALSGGSPGIVVMNAPKSVTANFEQLQLTQVAAPTFNPGAGTYSATQNVEITTATVGASIRYTLDGTPPSSTNGTPYSPGSPVSVPTSMTIKAIAFKQEMADSAVTSSTYTITPGVVAAPSFSPAGGTYSSSRNITITSATTDAEIWFTSNGADPDKTTGTGTLYETPVSVSSSTTIKAIAYKAGMTASQVTSAAYVIQGATSTVREYIRVGGRVIAIENVQQ